MENKRLILFFILFWSCENSDKSCDIKDVLSENYIFFKNFKNVNQITFKGLSSENQKYVYDSTALKNIDKEEKALVIDDKILSVLEYGGVILIHGQEHIISDIKVKKIERPTMWNKKTFCELYEYKLNDSIIYNHKLIIYGNQVFRINYFYIKDK